MASLKTMTKIADKIVADVRKLPDVAPPAKAKAPLPPPPVKAGKIIGHDNPMIAQTLQRDVPQDRAQLIASIIANVDAEHDATDRIIRAKYDTFVDILRCCANGVEPDGMKDVARAFIIRQGERTGKEFQRDEKTGEIIVNKLYLNQVAARFNTAGIIAYKQNIDIPYVLKCGVDYKAAYDKAAKEFVAANKSASIKPLSQEEALNSVCTLIKAAQPNAKDAATPKLKDKLLEDVAGDIKTKVEKKPELKMDVKGSIETVIGYLDKFEAEADAEELVKAMNAAQLWLERVVELLPVKAKPAKAK